MFVMGLGMVYTRHDSPADFVRRGIKLLMAGYLLNFFRQTLLLAVVNAFFKESGYDGGSLLGTFLKMNDIEFPGVTGLALSLLIAIVSISLCFLLKKVNQEMVINLMEKR